MNYFGTSGTLEGGYLPGLYIVEAPTKGIARSKLQAKTVQVGRGYYDELGLQKVEGAWAAVLRDTIDAIRNRQKEHYVDLGDGVFFVEV